MGMDTNRNGPPPNRGLLRGSTDPNEGAWVPGGNPWILVGTVVGAKLATIVIIMALSWNAEAGGIVAAMNWHYLSVVGLLVAGPVGYWVRVRRVRARREQLRRAEWMIDDAPAPPARAGVDRPRPPA